MKTCVQPKHCTEKGFWEGVLEADEILMFQAVPLTSARPTGYRLYASENIRQSLGQTPQ